MSRATAESAIRKHLRPGQQLLTPSRGAQFTIHSLDRNGVTLLFGAKETVTPLPWACWEESLDFLDGKGWVEIGGRFAVDADPSTLDGFLRRYIKRSTASWVAAVLEAAGLVESDGGRPAKVRLATT